MVAMAAFKSFVVLSFLLSVARSDDSEKCAGRFFESDSLVCVDTPTHCHLPSLPPLDEGPVAIVSSKIGGLRWQFKRPAQPHLILSGQRSAAQDVTITFDRNRTYQTMEGFGGAFTDAAGINIKSVPEALQECVLDSYFGEGGLGYTLGRLPIGGADFSPRGYTYDDLPSDGDEADPQLNDFALQEEDLKYKIPIIKKANEKLGKPVKLVASPWSAPAWMKDNKSLFGRGKLLKEYYDIYAEYIMKFLQEYKAEGVDVWALTPQNEPIDGLIPFFSFNAMGWWPGQQAEWLVKHLGPKLASSEFNDTKIYAIDDIRAFLPYWLDLMMSNEGVPDLVSGVAVHWYADFLVPVSTLDRVHDHHPNLPILYTEACLGSYPWDTAAVVLGDWGRAEQLADDMLDTMNHWNTGWIDWNLALSMTGGPNWKENFVDAPIIINASAQEAYKQPIYYAIAHLSRLVPPKSRRLHWSSSSTDHLTISAFLRPDGAVVVVVLNKNLEEVSIRLNDGAEGAARWVLPGKSLSSLIVPV